MAAREAGSGIGRVLLAQMSAGGIVTLKQHQGNQ